MPPNAPTEPLVPLALTPEVLDREFPSRGKTSQFNHAAVCPIPRRGVEAMAAYAARLTERGSLGYLEWTAEANELKRLAGLLVNASAASISIVPSTTWGLNIVAQGLDWNPGDHVITTESEFPANLAPWVELSRHQVEVTRVKTRDGAFTAADVEAALTPRTRLVCVSAVAFHTGFVAPMAELGALCRSRGILFGLDAIQALGVVAVDVEAAGVDFLSADGHKWLLGTEGCGLLFTRDSLRPLIRPPSGWMSLKSTPGTWQREPLPPYHEDGRRFEPGATATPGIYALTASLRLLLEIGGVAVRERIARTLAVLVDGLPALGYEPILFDGPPRSGILAARPPEGTSPHRQARALASHGIALSAREGFLRFSPHVSGEPAESARILELLKTV